MTYPSMCLDLTDLGRVAAVLVVVGILDQHYGGETFLLAIPRLFVLQKRTMKGDHIGEFEELVLLATHGLGEDAYGAAVQGLLERETGRTVTIGAVYAAL